MEGGELLEIDHWIFKRKQKFKLPEFINVLISEKIDFTKKTNNLDQVILRITETAVQVQFDKSNEQEDMIDAIEDKKKSKVAERELDPIEFVMSCICIFDNNYIQIKL